MTIETLGDTAVVLDLGRSGDDAVLGRVQALAAGLAARRPPGVIEVVPAFCSVTVFYDPARIESLEKLCRELRRRAQDSKKLSEPIRTRVVEIPVCYGGDQGPDLERVADQAGLSPNEVAELHSGVRYRVNAIGFAPGFPYLGGLPPRLHTPRRDTPRPRVPEGSVGIGSALTGIYPLAGPGGWNLIGRTPLELFRPRRVRPALLAVGDTVRFRVISEEEFLAWK